MTNISIFLGHFLPKEPPSYNWRYSNPGALDASCLSVLGYPLLLRPHVFVGRGDDNDEDDISVLCSLLNESLLHLRRLSADADGSRTPTTESINYDSKMGCCAVPSRFYELLRSVHGVKCDDGMGISFQSHFEENPYILHHHVISNTRKGEEKFSERKNRCMSPTKHADISYPSSYSDIGARGVREPSAVMASALLAPQLQSSSPRPLEFKRRVLTARNRKHVEVYPIKWIYFILDDTAPPSVASSIPNSSNLSEQHTVALLKAAATHLQDSNKQRPPRADRPSKPTIRRSNNRKTFSSASFNNPKGFVLASRFTPARQALIEMLHMAVPEKSSSCCRIWTKIGLTNGRKHAQGATKHGDGYELLDFDDIPFDMTVWEFSKTYSGTSENLKSMDLLIETRAHPNAKWKRSHLELSNRIQVGDFVDAQDSTGKWYEAMVRAVYDDYIKVHYLGWSSKWDSIIQRRKLPPCAESTTAPGPPAPLWSHTARWREEVSLGDEIEIREASSLVIRPKWFRAFVRELGREEDTPREIVGGAQLEEVEEEECVQNDDDDNSTTNSTVSSPKCSTKDDTHSKRHPRPKKPLLLLYRTRQVLVEVPQERFNTASRPSLSPKHLSASASKAITPGTKSKTTFLAPQPPFLRWVNLYGEEICQLYTHNKPHNDDPTPATITYAHDPARPPVEILRSFNNIHGAGFIRESIRGVPPAPGSVGLHNLGNSCFLNSILQCLNHIEPLTQYFLRGDYKPNLNTKNPLGSGGRVAVAYANILHDMWGGEYSTLAPRYLKQTVGNFAPQFNNVYQQDSQEFCSFLMDGLHEDLNRVTNKPYVEDFEGAGLDDNIVAIQSWRKHLLRHDSIIVDDCQGMHRSHLACPDCGNESVKFDVYSTISLPLPTNKKSSVTLADCLKEFTDSEILDEENAWYCTKCKKHVCARKLITLWSTPDILILHLKRFRYEKCARGGIVRNKVEDRVIFPVDNLDMTPYIMGPTSPSAPAVYKLFGVSEHTGCTANSGHYTATVRNSRDGNWYKFNDSHVGGTNGDSAITGGAYLLFYQRAKGRSRWAGMERFMFDTGIDPYGPVDEDENINHVKKSLE